jgi:hypothetical protein
MPLTNTSCIDHLARVERESKQEHKYCMLSRLSRHHPFSGLVIKAKTEQGALLKLYRLIGENMPIPDHDDRISCFFDREPKSLEDLNILASNWIMRNCDIFDRLEVV